MVKRWGRDNHTIWLPKPWHLSKQFLDMFKDGRITDNSLKERLRDALNVICELETMAQEKEMFLGLFLYYFIGIVINRIGSLLVEPILIKTKFLTFIDYPKFVKASKMDAKIEILSENNTMCRSLVALFITLLLAIGYEWLMDKCAFVNAHSNIIRIVFLFVIFLFSYRKQTKYVIKRCNANLDNE